jgi:hypothetical protein
MKTNPTRALKIARHRAPHPVSASDTRQILVDSQCTLMERLAWLEHCSGGRLDYLHEQTQGRINLIRKIQDCTEDGKVCTVWGGMDCDCATWEGRVTTHSLADEYDMHDGDGNPYKSLTHAVLAYIDRQYENAEGRLHFDVLRPSEAKDVESSSRDLALEAFEDGHPHVVYY